MPEKFIPTSADEANNKKIPQPDNAEKIEKETPEQTAADLAKKKWQEIFDRITENLVQEELDRVIQYCVNNGLLSPQDPNESFTQLLDRGDYLLNRFSSKKIKIADINSLNNLTRGLGAFIDLGLSVDKNSGDKEVKNLPSIFAEGTKYLKDMRKMITEKEKEIKDLGALTKMDDLSALQVLKEKFDDLVLKFGYLKITEGRDSLVEEKGQKRGSEEELGVILRKIKLTITEILSFFGHLNAVAPKYYPRITEADIASIIKDENAEELDLEINHDNNEVVAKLDLNSHRSGKSPQHVRRKKALRIIKDESINSSGDWQKLAPAEQLIKVQDAIEKMVIKPSVETIKDGVAAGHDHVAEPQISPPSIPSSSAENSNIIAGETAEPTPAITPSKKDNISPFDRMSDYDIRQWEEANRLTPLMVEISGLSFDALDPKNTKDSDKEFRKLTKEFMTAFAVRGEVRPGKEPGILELKTFPDLEGKVCLALFRLAGADIKNIKYTEPGEVVENMLNIGVGKKSGLTIDAKRSGENGILEKLTAIFGSSTGRFRDSESTVETVYRYLVSLGFLRPNRDMDRLVDFITLESYDFYAIERPRTFHDSYKNLIGLARFIQPYGMPYLFELFKNGLKPTDNLSKEQMEKLGIIHKDKKTGKVTDYSARVKEGVDKAESEINEMLENGMGIKSKRFGNILVDIRDGSCPNLSSEFFGARAGHADTYVKWAPDYQAFVIKTNRKFGKKEEERFPGTEVWHGGTLIRPLRSGKNEPLSFSLRDVLNYLTDGKLNTDKKLKEYLNTN